MNSNPFNAILLDVSSGMFYLLSVFVVFYLYSMAGMGDASGAIKGTYGESRSTSHTASGNVARTTGVMGQFGGKGIGNWWRNKRGNSK